MTQADTKTRLLDAAETLFSRQEFANTSLRAITAGANANLAAANYHFGSKEALLRAVIERRLLPLNQLRSERIDSVLQAAERSGTLPTVRDLMRAFIEPTLAFRCSNSGSRAFVSMVGRAMTAADPLIREAFLERVKPLIHKLHLALCLALPQIPADLILTRLFFTMGAVGHCLCFSGFAQVFNTSADCTPEGDDFMIQSLISYVTAGLEASC